MREKNEPFTRKDEHSSDHQFIFERLKHKIWTDQQFMTINMTSVGH